MISPLPANSWQRSAYPADCWPIVLIMQRACASGWQNAVSRRSSRQTRPASIRTPTMQKPTSCVTSSNVCFVGSKISGAPPPATTNEPMSTSQPSSWQPFTLGGSIESRPLGPFHHALDAAVAGKRRCRMHGGAPASPSRADLDLRPSLNTACMRQINFCLERDLLLRQALLVPSRVTCYLAFASL